MTKILLESWSYNIRKVHIIHIYYYISIRISYVSTYLVNRMLSSLKNDWTKPKYKIFVFDKTKSKSILF